MLGSNRSIAIDGSLVGKSSAGVAFSNTTPVYIPQAGNIGPPLAELVLSRSKLKKEEK